MPLFKQKKILRIEDQLTLDNCKLMHRLNYDNCPTPIANMFNRSTDRYEIRSLNVKCTRHRTMLVNKSFLCRLIIQWQLLQRNLKNNENLKSFSKELKKHLLSKY